MHIAVFHSVLGLRDVEREAGELLRARGYDVSIPDLFNGATATSIAEGAEIVAHLTWPEICGAAGRTLEGLPADTLLSGFSMGTGVASHLWPSRPHAMAAIFFHALPTLPENLRRHFPFQVHVGAQDSVFAPADATTGIETAARRRNARADFYRYPGAGHFFTDRSLEEYDQNATNVMWERVFEFLARVDSSG